jgi:hypothetical protein
MFDPLDAAGVLAGVLAAATEAVDMVVLELEDELPHAASVAASATPVSELAISFFMRRTP